MLACHGLSSCWFFALISVAAVAADIPKPPRPDPANPVNYVEWINQTMGAGVKENAAPVYRDAYAKHVLFEGDLKEVTKGPWLNNPQVSEWLVADREAISKFRQAAMMSECFFRLGDDTPTGDPRLDHLLAELVTPDFRAHRELTKALVAEGYRGWSQGDHNLLIANALTVIRSAHHLHNTPLLIQRLHGTACLALGHDALRNAMSLSEHPSKTAAAVMAGLRQADPATWSSLQFALLGERLAAWDWCQRVFVPGPKPGGLSLYEPLISRQVPDAKARMSQKEWDGRLHDMMKAAVSFEATIRELDEYFDAVEKWYGTRYDIAVERLESMNQIVPDSQNPMVRWIAVPDLTRPRVLDDRVVASRRATHLIAYILAHHGRTGRYPASLEEIQAPDMEELRTDPLWGRDFVYKTEDHTFTIYSVSENARDDGGDHSEDCKIGDFVFWPVQKKTATKPAR